MTTVISVTIVILVLQTVYLYTKLHSYRASKCLFLLQGSFILWAVIRLAEVYAPTPAIIRSSHMVQLGVFLFILLLLFFLLWRLDKKLEFSGPIILTAIILLVFMLITLIFGEHSLKILSNFQSFYLGSTASRLAVCKGINALYYIVPLVPSEVLSLILLSKVRKSVSLSGKLSLKTVIQSMGDCILVLDTKQRIMDANYSFFEALCSGGKPGTYQDFCSLLCGSSVIDEEGSQSMVSLPFSTEEIEIDFLEGKELLTCTCKATPLFDTKGNNIGTMISVHDITEYRKLMRELEEKKLELMEIKEKLQDYLQVANQLEAAKEKRKIYTKIQNSIGQEIMELLTMLEVVQIKTDTVTLQELELAVETCRSIIGRVRGSVNEIEKS